MVYYKITSLTSKLAKRHADKDATLKIAYRSKFSEKEHLLPVGGILYISSPSLPINLHKLRMKKLISIVELNKDTFMKLTNPSLVRKAPIPVAKKVAAKKPIPTAKEDKPKKRVYKKSESCVEVE